jgi:RNA polymerase sigma-70 factor (ECF subfamily)
MSSSASREFMEKMQSVQRIVLKICRVYGHSAEEREDLFQEILLNAWKSYGSFRGDSKFSTWLYRVALNTALLHRRQDGTHREVSLEDHHDFREPDSSVPEDTRILYQAIDQLNPVEKSLVILYLEDMSYQEIADVLGITENNVGVKLMRTKEKLKKILKSYGIG